MIDFATPAHPAMPAKAMEEAVDWLTILQSPTPAQCQAFDAWLASHPAHVDAYAKATAAWADHAVEQVTPPLASARPVPHRHPWPRWWQAAVTALLLVGVAALGKLNA